MTDKEFWLVMAETCEQAGCLPEYRSKYVLNDTAFHCEGVCEMIHSAMFVGLIDRAQRSRLTDQLHEVYGHREHMGTNGYWWNRKNWRKRVEVMRKLGRRATT